MSVDETTARDRAIEVGSEALTYLDKDDGASDRDCATVVVDALRAHPEVLRALAGAPTADVAAVRKRIADTLHMGLDDATPNDHLADDDDHERWVARVQEWADWIHEQYAPLLAAAPEGVDAADEVARAEKTVHDLRLTLADAEQAQGEMADQLDAAQAAIQRVREKHVSSLEGRWCATCRGPYPCPTVRALDGDTTEEGR